MQTVVHSLNTRCLSVNMGSKLLLHIPDVGGLRQCRASKLSLVFLDILLYTVEPLNKGHLHTEDIVPYLEVVPYWGVLHKK